MMSGLFEQEEQKNKERARPLADRVRPQSIEDVIDQEHLLGPSAPLAAFLSRGIIPSMILWGPPGTGKTTLAGIMAKSVGASFEPMSAVEAGVKDIREAINRAEKRLRSGQRTIVFIDEVHRFNKSQQDALLHAVEQGTITIIGATTENPSFEVNSALLSRCQVYKLKSLTNAGLRTVIERAIATDEILKGLGIVVSDWDALFTLASGDARSALNIIETSSLLIEPNAEGKRVLDSTVFQTAVQRRVARYDRAGDAHYDTISAFIKTIRGSDPDAALIYLAQMIDAGEDPLFIARRLIVLASEDVGNANPQALQLAVATFMAIERIGMPEGRLCLAQCTTYIASSPKSNSSFIGYEKAATALSGSNSITVPLHIRNAPTQLMKKENYGLGYKYPHDFDGHFVEENYFPEEILAQKFYSPTDLGDEKEIAERLRALWPTRK